MYYYVFEQPKTSADRKAQSKVKEHFEDLGIMGEISTASPARSAEELADMGLKKGANTIIAVGSDRHINNVVSLIKTVERGLNRDVVVGVVPLDQNSTMRERLRLSNAYEACEALKKRQYTTLDLGYIESASYFITSAEIHTSTPVEITLRADRWEVINHITDLVVFSDLSFSFYNNLASKKGFQKLTSWLWGGEAGENQVSIFHARTLQITGSVVLPVTVEGEVVTKTPTVIYRMPKALKVIIKRDRFVDEQSTSDKE
jgi:diacylglycerol kinase family enzyme